MTDIKVFDARDQLAEKMERIQSLAAAAADNMSKDTCKNLLQELHTSCQADSCTDPNPESFQLSVDQVCDAVDTRTKIKVETLGELFDFQRWTVDVGKPPEETPLDKLRAVRCCKDDKPDSDEEDIWYKSPLSPNNDVCPYALQDKWTGDRDISIGVLYYQTSSENIGYDDVSRENCLFYIFDPNTCFTPNNTCFIYYRTMLMAIYNIKAYGVRMRMTFLKLLETCLLGDTQISV